MEIRDRLAKRLTDDGRVGVGGDLRQDIADAVRLINRLPLRMLGSGPRRRRGLLSITGAPPAPGSTDRGEQARSLTLSSK